MIVKIASSPEERLAAFKLLYKKYVNKGLIKENKYKLYYNDYQLTNFSDIIIAIDRDKVIGTVTLISGGHLPCFKYFDDHLSDIKHWCGEAISLASNGNILDIKLYNFLIQLSQYRKNKFLLGIINPEYEKFYSKYLNMYKINGTQRIAYVDNNLGSLMCFDFEKTEKTGHRNFDKFFKEKFDPNYFKKQLLTYREKEYYASIEGW